MKDESTFLGLGLDLIGCETHSRREPLVPLVALARIRATYNISLPQRLQSGLKVTENAENVKKTQSESRSRRVRGKVILEI